MKIKHKNPKIRYIIFVLLMAISFWGFQKNQYLNAESNQKNYSLVIDGMTCARCQKAIEKTVKKIPGVIEIKANYQSGNGNVRFDVQKTDIEQIKKAIEELGYKVVKYKEL